MLCGSRIPVRMRMSSVCLTEKGRTQAAFAPATRAVGRAVWLWSHFTERRQGPAQALVRPGKNGISTQATGHVIKTDDRRGGGRDTRIPTSPPASSLSPQWVDREKGQTPPIRTPGARSAPLRPGQPPSDQDGPPGLDSPTQTRMVPQAGSAPSPGLVDNQLQQGGSWTVVPGYLPGAVPPPPPPPTQSPPTWTWVRQQTGEPGLPPELADHPQLTAGQVGLSSGPCPGSCPLHRGLLPAATGVSSSCRLSCSGTR